MMGTNGSHAEEAMDTEHGAGRPETTSTAKPALKMTFAQYRRVSNLIVLHMQKMEDSKSLKGPSTVERITELHPATVLVKS